MRRLNEPISKVFNGILSSFFLIGAGHVFFRVYSLLPLPEVSGDELFNDICCNYLLNKFAKKNSTKITIHRMIISERSGLI